MEYLWPIDRTAGMNRAVQIELSQRARDRSVVVSLVALFSNPTWLEGCGPRANAGHLSGFP